MRIYWRYVDSLSIDGEGTGRRLSYNTVTTAELPRPSWILLYITVPAVKDQPKNSEGNLFSSASPKSPDQSMLPYRFHALYNVSGSCLLSSLLHPELQLSREVFCHTRLIENSILRQTQTAVFYNWTNHSLPFLSSIQE